MHLIYKQLCLYINLLYIKKQHFFYCARRFILFYLYFSNQIEFDLQSLNQEFLLFLELLKKHILFNNSQ